MRRALFALSAGLLLAGCQTTASSENLLWLRTDGQRMSGNAALQARAHADLAYCQTQVLATGPSGIDLNAGAISSRAASDPGNAAAISAARACMGSRGYALVPESQAAATLASYAAAH
jgi:hypothetical protein